METYFCIECTFKHASTAFVLQRVRDLGYLPTSENLLGMAEILIREMANEEYQNVHHLVRLSGCLAALPEERHRQTRKRIMDLVITGAWWDHDTELLPLGNSLQIPHLICMADHATQSYSEACSSALCAAENAFNALIKEEDNE